MVDESSFEAALCAKFCADLTVRPVGDGFAVATAFRDNSGDKITFYAVHEEDGWVLEDDGSYLPSLIGAGIDIEHSQRGAMLDNILRESGAFWDRDSFEIRSFRAISGDELADHAVSFLSGLIRMRDLALVTREAVRSTFRDDAKAALIEQLGQLAEVEENVPVSDGLEDVPPDFLLTPLHRGRKAAIFIVSRNERLIEALLLHAEAQAQDLDDVVVIAMLEDENFGGISRKNFKRAQNRLDALPVFRGDEKAAIRSIVRAAKLEPAPP